MRVSHTPNQNNPLWKTTALSHQHCVQDFVDKWLQEIVQFHFFPYLCWNILSCLFTILTTQLKQTQSIN